MSTSNPFQVPACLQRADFQQQRRERFKRAFIAVMAAIVILVVAMLIQGCKTEKTASATPITPLGAVPAPAPVQPGDVATVDQKPSWSLQRDANTAATTTSAQSAPAIATPAAASENGPAPAFHSASVYVVKSGDTLIRIAKKNGTTVRALKAANSLSNDRIIVGARLKIPEA